MLLVTQDEDVAREMDAVWFMRGGRVVVAAGPPTVVLDGEGAGTGFFSPRQAAWRPAAADTLTATAA